MIPVKPDSTTGAVPMNDEICIDKRANNQQSLGSEPPQVPIQGYVYYEGCRTPVVNVSSSVKKILKTCSPRKPRMLYFQLFFSFLLCNFVDLVRSFSLLKQVKLLIARNRVCLQCTDKNTICISKPR